MASFSDDPSEFERLDWRVLQSGFVSLYFRREQLDTDLAWFRAHAYRVTIVDCSDAVDARAMLTTIGAELRFPEHYGRNLDAFNDCLSDLEIPQDGGRAIVLRRFDAFAARDRPTSQAILDILANGGRRALLFGRRMVTLVQSDDPRIAFEPVGASGVHWNSRERLDAHRGP